jgi:hypothetical protein
MIPTGLSLGDMHLKSSGALTPHGEMLWESDNTGTSCPSKLSFNLATILLSED